MPTHLLACDLVQRFEGEAKTAPANDVAANEPVTNRQPTQLSFNWALVIKDAATVNRPGVLLLWGWGAWLTAELCHFRQIQRGCEGV